MKKLPVIGFIICLMSISVNGMMRFDKYCSSINKTKKNGTKELHYKTNLLKGLLPRTQIRKKIRRKFISNRKPLENVISNVVNTYDIGLEEKYEVKEKAMRCLKRKIVDDAYSVFYDKNNSKKYDTGFSNEDIEKKKNFRKEVIKKLQRKIIRGEISGEKIDKIVNLVYGFTKTAFDEIDTQVNKVYNEIDA